MAVVAGFVTSIAIATPALAADVSLMPDAGQDARTLNLGESRDPATVNIRFVAASKLPATPEADLSDVQTSDGRELDATLPTPKVSLKQGGRTADVAVEVTPGKAAQAGSYVTQLLLRAPGVTDARSNLTVTLSDKPVAAAAFWATLLLLFGAGLGLLARWIAGTASTLKALEDRLATVEASVQGHDPLPIVFRTKLIQVRTQLAYENAGDAENTLKNDLEGPKTTAAIDVADKAQALGRKISEQQSTIAVLPELESANRGKLEQVLAREREWIDAMVQATDYDSTAQSTERANRLSDAQRFSAFLPYYHDKDKRSALAEALEAFAAGEFGDAEKKWRDATGAPGAEEALGAAPPQVTPQIAVGSPGQDLSRWLIRHAPLLAQAFTALGLVILGLFTVYDPSTTFRGGNGFLDAVTLFAWGLGSALAGGGISDITGKLTAGRSGSA
jgi:hypothetical protein